MVRDLKDLMHEALPQHVAELDLDRVEQRASRRRAIRLAAAAAGVVGVLAIGVAVVAGISTPETPVIEEPPTPTVEETTAPTEAPTTSDATPDDPTTVGETLSLDALPPMSEHGVAVETEQGVAFVGLDGTVYGVLDGYRLHHATSVPVPGPVEVSPPDRAWDGTWVDPANGTTLAASVGVPVGYSALLAPTTYADPGRYVLHGGGVDASFSTMTTWHLSAGHRTVTWVECPDPGGRVGPDCVSRSVDLDMGGESEGGDPACWSSGEFADFNRVATCHRWWGDGASWLDVFSAGTGEERIELPEGMPDGTHFTKAFLGDGVVAEIARPDGTITVGAYRDGEWHEVLPTAEPVSARLLGVARDGQTVATVLIVEGAGETAGVWVVGDGEPRRIGPRLATGAQLWVGTFDLEAVRATAATITGDGSGRTFALVRGVDVAAGTITVDEADWLSGEAARAAYEAETGDPDGPPNDYHVRNDDTAETTYAVADDASISHPAPGSLDTRTGGTLDDVRDALERFGDWTLFWLTIEDGVVTAIEWQYTP